MNNIYFFYARNYLNIYETAELLRCRVLDVKSMIKSGELKTKAENGVTLIDYQHMMNNFPSVKYKHYENLNRL